MFLTIPVSEMSKLQDVVLLFLLQFLNSLLCNHESSVDLPYTEQDAQRLQGRCYLKEKTYRNYSYYFTCNTVSG